MENSVKSFELTFGNGDKLSGKGRIARDVLCIEQKNGI